MPIRKTHRDTHRVPPVRDEALRERMKYWGNGPGVITVWLRGRATQVIGMRHSRDEAPYALREIEYTDIKFVRVADEDALILKVVEIEDQYEIGHNRDRLKRLMRKIKAGDPPPKGNSEC